MVKCPWGWCILASQTTGASPETKRLVAPFCSEESRQTLRALAAGDSVLISGAVYSARDAAHKRLCALLESGQPLPFDLDGGVFYYMGPTPAPEGRPIGSAGPTTASRMDAYAPALIRRGLAAMIGKGVRSPEVVDAMRQCGAVYFAAIGGAGALLSTCIQSAETVAFDDLGTEAVRLLRVENFPARVAIDTRGNSLYETGVADYLAHAQER